MSSISKVAGKIEVRLRWDPSPWGSRPCRLDIVAATYTVAAPHGRPVYVVNSETRAPDGTINMSRHSETGQGYGDIEVMVLELDRLAPTFGRVVVGVAIHQNGGTRTFGDLSHARTQIVEGYKELLSDDFSTLGASTAATVGEFTKDASGDWEFRPMVRGFDSEPVGFSAEMGSVPQA
ncbi:TerD family protein [Streptomyces sp. NPDC101175]|uniref:TerD family protein n=1 Tax=Streptomyces sp. NPDC101175 TaxID=3366123 RepID=UPI0038392D2C